MKLTVCVLTFLIGLAISSGTPGGRIVGGWEAQRGQFPFIVSAQYCRWESCFHNCGGIILSDTWILTAAHCITLMTGGEYVVMAGILDLNDTNIERQEVRVAQSIVHPKYQGDPGAYDIGLWKLERPLEFNYQVLPALLPADDYVIGPEADLVGWGSIGVDIFPIMPNRLHTVTVPVIPQTECLEALIDIIGERPNLIDLENNICTGPLDESISACSGDFGGPLVQQGRIVVGVTSAGIGPCDIINAPTVYVKVGYHVQWITDHIFESQKKMI